MSGSRGLRFSPGRPNHGGKLLVLGSLTAVVGAIGSCPARASAEPRSVAVLPPACPTEAFAFVPFLDSLRVELASTDLACCVAGRREAWPPPDASVLVELALAPCAAPASRVQVSVSAPANAAKVKREVGLGDVGDAARPRTLALAVAELMRGLADPLAAEQTPPVRPAVVAVPAPVPRVEPARVSSTLYAAAEAATFPGRRTVEWGGRAGLATGWGHLRLDLDVAGGFASAQTDQGEVLLRTVRAGLGVGLRLGSGPVLLAIGPYAEIGWAFVRGQTRRSDVYAGAGSDLLVQTGLRSSLEIWPRSRLRPLLTLAGGAVPRGVRAQANGVTVVGITGYYALVGLGVAISP